MNNEEIFKVWSDIYQPGKGRQAGRVTISGKDLNILRRARVKSDAEMQEIIKNLSGIDP
jgi:hypothetical protein